MKNNNLEKFFNNIDIIQNGNLLFIARIIISEAIYQKEDKLLEDLLKILEITRPAPLLLRDFDDI